MRVCVFIRERESERDSNVMLIYMHSKYYFKILCVFLLIFICFKLKIAIFFFISQNRIIYIYRYIVKARFLCIIILAL